MYFTLGLGSIASLLILYFTNTGVKAAVNTYVFRRPPDVVASDKGPPKNEGTK